MNINRIALYLAGKLPPYYQAPFDKLELIELIRGFSIKGFSDEFFKIIDSADFYSMCLNRVEKADPDGLINVIKKLSIPEDAGGLSSKDLIKGSIEELKREFKEMEKDGTSQGAKQKRGYKFEKWLEKLFRLFELKPRASYKTTLDQIDGSFELNGKEYLLEAKWIANKVDKTIIDGFFGEINRTLVGTVGLIISTSGFNKGAKEAAAGHKNILLMDEKDIKALLDSEIELDDLIRKIRRRMAEEGKPYLD